MASVSGRAASTNNFGRSRRRDIEAQMMGHHNHHDIETATAVTGATSDCSVSIADMDPSSKDEAWRDPSAMLALRCQVWSGGALAVFLCASAFVSPAIMVVLPQIEALDWKVTECGPECDGLLISFSFKLLILLIATWAVFVRVPRARSPRIYIYRSVVLALLFIIIMSYWIFYYFRFVVDLRYDVGFQSVVLFALSLVDALLFIHYLAVILIEIRHLQPQYAIKVVRSPDGHGASYNIGQMSIQSAAAWVLEHYYQDFPIYNPHLEIIPSKSSSKSEGKRTNRSTAGSVITNGYHPLSPATPALKYYDVDGITGTSTPNALWLGSNGGVGNGLGPSPGLSYASMSMSGRTAAQTSLGNNNAGNSLNAVGSERDPERGSRRAKSHHRSHHNDRFYEEHEYERRVKKRRARLITAAEEAFTHIKRVGDEQGPAIPMDPHESAQAIFPSMARALQKYLRITRQQPRHTMQSILQHLGTCLTYDMSAKAFLEKYLVASPVLQSDSEHKAVQPWGLVCETLLSRTIEQGTVFLLRQGHVSLLVTVSNLPQFHLTEEIIAPKRNKFVFRMNSETSV